MTKEMRAYAALIGITLITFIFEEIGAYATGSHALAADAWHVLGDGVSFMVGLLALLVRSFGRDSKTLERITSILNFFFLAGIALWAAEKGIARLMEPVHIPGESMLVFAVIGMVGNVLQLHYVRRIKHAHTEKHTFWGQVLHIISDLISSVAIVVAGVLILWQGWLVADAIAALVVAKVVGLFAVLQAWNLYKTLRTSSRRDP